MRAKVLLADSAEVREGLLFLLGGAWNEIGPQPQPFAIAGVLEVEWDEANAQHEMEIAFEDEDGAPLTVPTPAGLQPLKLSAKFEVGRPPGSARGSAFNVPLSLPMLPIPWTPGRRYVAIVRVDGNEMDRLRFLVRPGQPVSPAVPPR
jgi:hypothetical protein